MKIGLRSEAGLAGAEDLPPAAARGAWRGVYVFFDAVQNVTEVQCILVG